MSQSRHASIAIKQNTAQRYPTIEYAHIEVYGRTGKLSGKIKNISLTGALIELNGISGEYVPKEGDLVQMTVDLNSIGKTHHKDAEVMWNDGVCFGIRFVPKNYIIDNLFSK